MGNMLFNRRVEDNLMGDPSEDRRIFPSHMYTGPLKLGDPNYRGLSKMEEDPLITQRMRDISRTQLCTDTVEKFQSCSQEQGLKMWYKCRHENSEMVNCVKEWFYDSKFKEAVIEEYLNERSHYRQTGIKTRRYKRNVFLMRDIESDPPLDDHGRYIPQKPTGWDESYPDGPPKWAYMPRSE